MTLLPFLLLLLAFASIRIEASEKGRERENGFTSFCDAPSFTLEWNDEFEGEALDLNKWSVVCSSNEGNLESGMHGNGTSRACSSTPFPTHVPSNGAECRSARCVAGNVYLKDGMLHLVSKREPSGENSGGQVWTTGAVKTWGKQAWTTKDGPYRVCVSAKLPGYISPLSVSLDTTANRRRGGGRTNFTGQGIWPAHWLMPYDKSCDPDEGEMDVMEMVNGDRFSYSTYHWQDNFPNSTCAYPEGHQEIFGKIDLGTRWGEEFHEFAVERSGDHVVFAVDGNVVVNSSLSEKDVLLWEVPFYLILNTAVGGPWPGEPDNTTISPTYHVVDYVRVTRFAERN